MKELKVLFEIERPKHEAESHFSPIKLILEQELLQLTIFEVFGHADDIREFEAQKVETRSVFKPAHLLELVVAIQCEGKVRQSSLVDASDQLLRTFDRTGFASLIETEIFHDGAAIFLFLVLTEQVVGLGLKDTLCVVRELEIDRGRGTDDKKVLKTEKFLSDTRGFGR